MIWEATSADIPALMDMGRKFAAKACLAESVGYDEASAETTFGLMIESPHYVILMSEAGTIGGAAVPHPFNASHIMAQELFWWAESGGLQLLAAFEEWAAARAGSVRMACLEAASPDRVAKIYERRGYRPLERGFIRTF